MRKTFEQLGLRVAPETGAAIRAAALRSGLKMNAWVEAALLAAAQGQEVPPPDTPHEGGRRKRRAPAPASSLPVPAASPEAEGFASAFLDSLKGIHPGFREPTAAALRGWTAAARLMLSVDGRPLGEAQAIAAWLFNGEDRDAAFWRRQVFSVVKFREKYEQLAAIWRGTLGPPMRAISATEQAVRNIMADDGDLFGRRRHVAG